ncbi:MAG: LysM peptidoglycan-binding domain-containing protein [Gammaproteobacteria bacterium]|nr:LysM peptidoglycan-binding domain-containing protein [Gammaproteobacteria bacterium]
MSPVTNRLFALIVGVSLVAWGAVRADVLEMQPDHPDRYTVVDGDTLWSIASRFLKSPWNWPKIWKINQQVENPHLIYPGDVILLRWVDGQPELSVLRPERVQPQQPTVPGAPPAPVEQVQPRVWRPAGDRQRLSPKVRSELREQAIPTIPPDAIGPFLTRPLVVSPRELEKSGYMTVGVGGRVALGDNDEFYARGIDDTSKEFFYIFRKGRPIVDPRNKRLIGYEAIYLGDAKMVQPGRNRTGTSKLTITRIVQEVLPTDRLLAVEEEAPLPVYMPRAPKDGLEGTILMAHQGLTEVGAMSVVAVNLGEREGMEQGHVLQIWRHEGKHRDPVTNRYYMRPDEKSGVMMVFRTFDRVSYALILETTQPVHVGDRVTTP